ncbi:hypothetical protein M422DRAFT_274405 [Sphaerobolus stellatus SS14]|uniref:Uncharacterized protein n=1 Tax=Sphaerobolus stellatus (strain SS14) TaxID=990650 RepID=A0A0C9U6K8_SPHS4|nr:hypothetical protein M422DRAFT_274405 [Sphaerobolus stellatus SS14]
MTDTSNLRSTASHAWTPYHLDELNVEVIDLTIEEFFGCDREKLPNPEFSYPFLEEVLTCEDASNATNKMARSFLMLMRNAAHTNGNKATVSLARYRKLILKEMVPLKFPTSIPCTSKYAAVGRPPSRTSP